MRVFKVMDISRKVLFEGRPRVWKYLKFVQVRTLSFPAQGWTDTYKFSSILSEPEEGGRVKRLTITTKGSSRYFHVRTFQYAEGKFTPTYEGVALNIKQTLGLAKVLNLVGGELGLYPLDVNAWIGKCWEETMLNANNCSVLPVILYVMAPHIDLCDKNLMFASAAHVMRDELIRLNNEKCEGCLNSYPSQSDHDCLMADDFLRTKYLDDAKVYMGVVRENFAYLARKLQRESFSADGVREVLKENFFAEAVCAPASHPPRAIAAVQAAIISGLLLCILCLSLISLIHQQPERLEVPQCLRHRTFRLGSIYVILTACLTKEERFLDI